MSETNPCQTDDWLVARDVEHILCSTRADHGQIRDVLQKARELKGLTLGDVAALCHIATPAQLDELFDTCLLYTSRCV